MGTQMRERYVSQTNLLPSHYDPSMLKVITSFDNETVESAIAQLNGFYPATSNSINQIQ